MRKLPSLHISHKEIANSLDKVYVKYWLKDTNIHKRLELYVIVTILCV